MSGLARRSRPGLSPAAAHLVATPCRRPLAPRGKGALDAKGSRRELFGAWGHPLFSLFSSNQSPHTPADPKGSADNRSEAYFGQKSEEHVKTIKKCRMKVKQNKTTISDKNTFEK